MKKIITFLGVEKVVYEFDLIDIRKALSKYFDIEPSNDYEFDVYERYDNIPAGASLVIKYSTPAANKAMHPDRLTDGGRRLRRYTSKGESNEFLG